MTAHSARVLVLHGRGSAPDRPPCSQVAAYPWPVPVHAPALAAEWFSWPVDHQLDAVDTWLDTAAVAIGHSWSAWLLLCAAVARSSLDEDFPPMLLLSSVLGAGRIGQLGGWRAPYSLAVRKALGLDASGRPTVNVGKFGFIHGAKDDQCPVDDVETLEKKGFSVTIVPDARHRLESELARAAVDARLVQFAALLERS